MSDHWHVLALLIVLLILCLTCLVNVGDVGVRTLKYFINLWSLLHRTMGYSTLTRLSSQFRIIFPTTDQTLRHTRLSRMRTLLQVQQLSTILRRLSAYLPLSQLLHLLNFIITYQALLLAVKTWTDYERLRLISKMQCILMLMCCILTALIIVAWHRGLQRIVSTLIVRFG